MAEPGAEERGAEERERLRAAGALVGVPVTVSDDDAWRLDESGLRVGLGWYARRGHDRDEAVALALLQLWEGVRDARMSPDRARRRRSIVAARPELAPLVGAVARLQAAWELLTALPGLREPLTAAVRRSVLSPSGEHAAEAGEREPRPRHLQWVALLLAVGIGPGGGVDAREAEGVRGGVDPAVAAEWRTLGARSWDADGPGRGAAADPSVLLRRALAPDPRRPPLARLERALALLLPPYERLLARDAAERGLGDAGRGAAEPHEGGADAEDFGAAGAGDDAGDRTPEQGAGDGDAGAGNDERARAGEGRRTAEGADLFAAEQAGFVSAVLATPLPAEGALLAAPEPPPRAETGAPRADQTWEPGGGAAAGRGGTALSDYRSRVAELADAIDRMRDVWARVVSERVARVRATGRRPAAEGDLLHPEALAGALAAARAGVARPAAFLRTEPRPRLRRRAGSTDYVLLVDRSASMQGRTAEAAADAALIMLEALAGAERDISHAEQRLGVELELEIRTALVVFDADVDVVKPLGRGLGDEARRRMHAAIRAPRGSTNDGAALRAAAEQLGVVRGGAGPEREAEGAGLERRRVVLLLSDGGSNDPAAADRELRRLRAAGVAVHGIGIGSDEVVRRYAPSSRRIDEPGGIASAIAELVERELP